MSGKRTSEIRPYIRILSEPEIPDILYKYTSDAGVAGLREGFVRFGSFEEYRDTENEAIRDPYENSVVSRCIPMHFPDGRRASMRLSMQMPGVVFCASADEALRGAFGYSRRVAIRSEPFFRALHNALTSCRHVFDAKAMMEHRKIAAVKFSESDSFSSTKEQWRPVHPKEWTSQTYRGRVLYRQEPHSKMSPRQILTASVISGDAGIEMIRKGTRMDDPSALRKPAKFSHEKECRVALNFMPWKTATDQGGEPSYFTDSVFVRIENPREALIFDDN